MQKLGLVTCSIFCRRKIISQACVICEVAKMLQIAFGSALLKENRNMLWIAAKCNPFC
jgi:hypothetical protein